MHSLKQQITLLVVGAIIIMTAGFMLAVFFQTRATALMAAETKAMSDLATVEALINLQYPGPWKIKDGVLYKGEAKINDNFAIVDYVEKLTGDSCTIFLNDVRVTTTVRDDQGNRAVGTRASREVVQKVLGAKQEYVGEAYVVGRKYQTAYKPITDESGEVIGMLYVGAPRTFYDTILYGSLKVMGLVAVVLTLVIGLGAWVFTQRTIIDPLQEIIAGTRRVALGSPGQPVAVHSNNEIGELARAFNQMVEGMQALANELGKVAGFAQNNGQLPLAKTVASPVNQQEIEIVPKSQEELPKGLNRVTLEQVVRFLERNKNSGVSSDEVAEGVNLSKVTVRRYLDYLERCGLLDIDQKYGSVGRPLKIYRLKT
ncbi:HAMP domain-containing protein [Desulfofundulus thermobenzoicus]|uniref:HAMP domain-containing protein n=2 Tax=Desulfofundulus thermobenzoicus TaxID=29376 RepID=A0A6N7ILC1_9FIRM|nr:HAMP domain-containing protein [Desulfofundulus thermobenzoicus]